VAASNNLEGNALRAAKAGGRAELGLNRPERQKPVSPKSSACVDGRYAPIGLAGLVLIPKDASRNPARPQRGRKQDRGPRKGARQREAGGFRLIVEPARRSSSRSGLRGRDVITIE
jgi:hypothetical protein